MTEIGRVSSHERFLHGICVLHLFGSNGVPARVEVIVDTGFAGSISLPQVIIDALDMSWVGARDAVLADGSVVQCDLFNAELEWQGETRLVEVAEMGGNPLIGTELMRGSELRMMVEDNGVVEITPFDQL